MALIVLTTIAAYSNSFRGEFIFDDMKAIAENPTIHSLWPLWPIFCPPNQGETVMDRPILNLTLAVNYAMGGVDVWGYHAGNLLIHAVASLLFFGILRRTFLLPSMHDRWGETALPLSCIIALLWAIHPLQTESVTYIVQRAESLMGLFYLLTFYCVIRGATARRRGVAWYAAASFACVIGMASKEVMASVPLTVLLYDRAFLTGSFRETLRRRWVLYFVLASTWGLLVWLILSGVAVYGIGVGMSWWAYFGTQCWAIVHYLRLCVWPYPLLFDYGSYLATGFWNVAPYAAMLVSLGIATMVALWRWPKLGFLGFCFFAILAPTSSFIPACVTQTVAEHRMYLPLAVVLTALTVGVWTAAQRQVQQKRLDAKTARVACGILAGVAAAVFAMLTLERNRDYRTEESIWRDSMIKAPYSARAYVNLGAVLLSQGKASEALPLLKKAVAIDPNYADAHNNLGNALAQDGQTQAAIVQFEKTIQLAPRYANAYYNLATVLSRCNRNEEAIAQFEKALELNPQYLEAHCNLAATLVADGRLTEAISHYRAALQIDPNLIGACSKLAELLATHPDASVRNGQEAVGLAERAARLSPGLGAGLLDTLAAAYAEAGRFPEAVQAASSALDIASQQENAPLVKSLTAKIELYRKGIPFRQTPQTPRERP
jgi:tetratricopeptide (TPR) repeat protein